MHPVLKLCLRNWRFFVLVLAPFVLLPVFYADPGNETPLKFKCAYVILLMSVYWTSEAMPLAVTSLLPVVLFPLFNIQSTADVCQNYMRESVMMFLGGIILALSIEYSGLHRRIALKIMILVGTSEWRLLLGLMITTMFLSCWIIINTAVAAMMVPIVTGLIQSIEDGNIESATGEGHGHGQGQGHKKRLNKLFMLAVGYAANIGGTAVIIGSNPNLIARELLTSENIGQNGKYTDINFSSWIAFNMPIAIINMLITYVYLGFLYIGRPKWLSTDTIFRRKTSESQAPDPGRNGSSDSEKIPESSTSSVNKMLRSKLLELGGITFHEFGVLTLFTIVILLWFTRDPQIFHGWASLFHKHHVAVTDSTVALAVVVLMFVIPNTMKLTENDESGPPRTLLNWQFIQTHLPWNVVLLVGGGFAISDGSKKSGLSGWIGEQLSGLESLPNPVILLIFLVVISCLTEIISNAAAINLILPILIALSKRINIHPLYLSLPGAIACQYAFMLPVSNPPNAIVFSAGEMKILDMIKAGSFLNFACLAVLFLMNISWGSVIFNYGEYIYANTNTTVINTTIS